MVWKRVLQGLNKKCIWFKHRCFEWRFGENVRDRLKKEIAALKHTINVLNEDSSDEEETVEFLQVKLQIEKKFHDDLNIDRWYNINDLKDDLTF